VAVAPAPSAVVDRLRAAGCVFAEDEAALLADEAASPARLEELVRRRVAGEPLEHLVGWAAFDGLRIAVEPGVFVPRRRTELLVDEAAALLRPGDVVVDLCCGSGAVGAALLARLRQLELHAADLDPAAVRCARANLPGVPVHEGDLFATLPLELRGRVRVLVANVPYVPTAAVALLPPEARQHESRMALDGGDDGLAVARRVVGGAGGWLAPGGSLLFETGEAQVDAALALLAGAGLRTQVARDEERGATVVVGTA
jgi:release factor glutamine methyltransferase